MAPAIRNKSDLLTADDFILQPADKWDGREGDEAHALLPSPVKEFRDNLSENSIADSTVQSQKDDPEIGPFILLRRDPLSPRRFEMIQHFECVVQEVDADAFVAVLFDLNTPTNPQEVAEFPIREISSPDRHLLAPGSVLYWTIGYETSETGQVRHVFEFRMRRTPKWSPSMIESVERKSAELFKWLANDEQIDAPGE